MFNNSLFLPTLDQLVKYSALYNSAEAHTFGAAPYVAVLCLTYLGLELLELSENIESLIYGTGISLGGPVVTPGFGLLTVPVFHTSELRCVANGPLEAPISTDFIVVLVLLT